MSTTAAEGPIRERPESAVIMSLQPRLVRKPVAQVDTVLTLLEDSPQGITHRMPAWHILVVDDEEEVHNATRFALKGIEVLGRPLELLHARDTREALRLLKAHRDIAVVLLDVVMQKSDSGLLLVEQIRNDLGLQDTRIILRTGQPGSAPELDVITHYDINDYRNKSELTATRLITTLTSALRNYGQIRSLDSARHGLCAITEATSSLLDIKNLQDFAATILRHTAKLVGEDGDGLVVLAEGIADQRLQIVGATGRLQSSTPITADTALGAEIRRAFAARKAVATHDKFLTLHIPAQGRSMLVLLELAVKVPHVETDLLQLFGTHIRLCADNLAFIEQLRESAYRDSLTGLPNRTHLVDELARSFNSRQEPMALALIDMDNFNTVAETLGQEKGNELIKTIARRLSERFRDQHVYIARTSGDEFALLGPEGALTPQRLQTLFAVPLMSDATAVALTATIGLAPVGGPCASPSAVLSGAYSALKRGKDRQQNSVNVYTSTMSRELSDRVSLLQDMRTALVRNEFHVVLQPQICLADNSVTGVEALIRWRKADGTLVPPANFIPVAERAGLIGAIGEWVFRTACKQLASLRQRGVGDLLLAINVSVAQLRDPTFGRMVEGILREYSIPPHLVEIEITESIAIDGLDSFLAMIDQLKDIGLRVALDDFGTGFSSLTLLHRLRIDRLKLDRSFVCELGRGRRCESVARTVVELGLSLGLEVIAEGVETIEQAEHLKAIGCHGAQGYLFARPMELRTLETWLNTTATPGIGPRRHAG